jgi:hypothetical protein
MIQRCTNPNHEAYERYASKGITVCKDWFVYSNFRKDMGVRPEGLTLDRIDNNKGYYAENCRWTTRQTQQLNRGKFKNTTSKYKNVYWSKKSCKWMARYLKIDGTRVYLGLFENEDDAGRVVNEYRE